MMGNSKIIFNENQKIDPENYSQKLKICRIEAFRIKKQNFLNLLG
jgi:hypothetical protein